LYKYFSERKFAQEFLEGKILFRSLGYFRDYEDREIRRDEHEGTAIYRPPGGLVGTNHTQGTSFVLPGWSFQSSAKWEEILVFCLSRALSKRLCEQFEAVACVEIDDIGAFCRRVEAALPASAVFPGPVGHTRIGRRIDYYEESEGGSPRWAVPDLIATSKPRRYAWQREFRLVFSLTDALAFENVSTRLVQEPFIETLPATAHQSYLVETQSLRDICRLYECQEIRDT
jgi:hypothetical protein